jgi:mono/diheme cytochrome c family protein
MTRALVLGVAALAVLTTACGPEEPAFTRSLKLGGKVVVPEVLNRGKEAYTHYCRACHGDKGDGKGPSASGMRPPPRDFTLGRFKFAAVPAGQLPHDDDLVRVVKRGLAGTAMLAWDVPDADLAAILQYLKTFSRRWQTDEPGEKVVTTEDPWLKEPGGEKAALSHGQRMYHAMECWACHPAYASRQEIYDWTFAVRKAASSDFRQDMYDAVAKETDYGVNVMPPDFLVSDVRSGATPGDLYRSIASGIGGTAMPQWKGILPEKDIWAMVHFVRSLVALKGTREAEALRARVLAAQPPLKVIKPPPPAADGGAADDGAAADAQAADAHAADATAAAAAADGGSKEQPR